VSGIERVCNARFLVELLVADLPDRRIRPRAWDRWLSYQRSRDTLEVLKTYAAQGTATTEIARRLTEDLEGDEFGDERMGRHYRRHRRYYRWGPYREWRAAIITGSIAAGLWFAAWYGFVPGTVGPFKVVAIILSFVAGANLLFAVLGSRYGRNERHRRR